MSLIGDQRPSWISCVRKLQFRSIVYLEHDINDLGDSQSRDRRFQSRPKPSDGSRIPLINKCSARSTTVGGNELRRKIRNSRKKASSAVNDARYRISREISLSPLKTITWPRFREIFTKEARESCEE